MPLTAHIQNFHQFQVQNRILGIEEAYKYVVKGLEKGVSEINIAKTIKVQTDNGFVKLIDLIND